MAGNKIYTDEQLAKLFGVSGPDYVTPSLKNIKLKGRCCSGPITQGRIMMSDDEEFVLPAFGLTPHAEHEEQEAPAAKGSSRTSSASPESLDKLADSIEKMVQAGRIRRDEVGQLIDFGLDQEAVDAWETKYGDALEVLPGRSDGMTCKSCGEFYPYADKANQADGSFKCFGCRH